MQFPDVGLIKAFFFFIVRHQGGDIKNIRLEKYEADHQMDQSAILTNQIFIYFYQKLNLHNSPSLRAAAPRLSGPSGSLLHIYLSPILLKNLHLRDPRLTERM